MDFGKNEIENLNYGKCNLNIEVLMLREDIEYSMTATNGEDSKNILLIEDDAPFAELTKTFLEREDEDISISMAFCGQSGLEKALSGEFDCIVCDYDMPHLNGVEVLRKLRSSGSENADIPFILFTGKSPQEIASTAVSAGVTDYMEKSGSSEQYKLLANKIKQYTKYSSDNSDSDNDDKNMVKTRIDSVGKEIEIQRENEREIFIELYRISTDPELSFDEKINTALELGRAYLGMDYGFVTHIGNEVQTIEFVQPMENNSGLKPGGECPLEETYCKNTLTNEGLLAIHDAIEYGWENSKQYKKFGHKSYIGERIIVEGEVYGTLCFNAIEARDKPFTETEKAIVELLTGWASYEIEQQQYEEKLEEQNERLDQFASFISHDLRNPLSVARGYLDLEREENDSENLAKIAEAHERMELMIEQLLDLSQGSMKVDKTDVNLRNISESSWDNTETKNAELQVLDDLTFKGDYDKLLNVFENIFRNAIEHGGDSVVVQVGRTENGFFIEDNGPGFEDPSRVFENSYTTSETGNGLGLSIVESIVDSHHWSVEAMNGERGARFEFNL